MISLLLFFQHPGKSLKWKEKKGLEKENSNDGGRFTLLSDRENDSHFTELLEWTSV
jgi:hypothetical protein